MSALPSGWVAATVGDLVELLSGPAFKSSEFRLGGAGVRLLRGDNIEPGSLRWLNERLWPEHLLPGYEHLLLQAEDIILAMDRPIISTGLKLARVKESDTPALLVQRVARLRPNDPSAAAIVYYALLHDAFKAALQSTQTGTQLPHITLKQIASFEFPLPPLAEQGRIVAAIEEAFSKLDVGVAGLKATRQRLARMRDSVLAAAVSGRLVPQDPTDPSASRLLADVGAEALTDSSLPTLPKGWAWVEMRNLSSSAGYGTSVKCGYTEDGPGVLRIPNIQAGVVDVSDLKRAPDSAGIGAKLYVSPGDLLIVRTNGSRDLIGRSAPVVREIECSFASYLIRFRMIPELVNVEYVSLMLSAQDWRRRLESGAASSAGQYNLSLRTLEPLPVALPPLAEQQRIVDEVDRLFSFIEAAERAVDAGLARSAALRRSVLKAAFEGKLSSQDPSDEPASVLLERIRAERAASPTPKRRRARATA